MWYNYSWGCCTEGVSDSRVVSRAGLSTSRSMYLLSESPGAMGKVDRLLAGTVHWTGEILDVGRIGRGA